MTGLQNRWCAVARLIAATIGLATLSLGAANAQQPGSAAFEGVLSVIWGDPRPGFAGGETRFNLTLQDGTTVPLEVGAAQQSAAIGHFGKRVRVLGRTTGDTRGRSRIAVDQLDLVNPADVAPAQSRAKRRVLYILLKFKNDAQEPHPPSFFAALTNPKVPPAGSNTPATINGFFNKTSWGNLQWRADVAGTGGLSPTGWLTLPFPKSSYAGCGWSDVCADLDRLADDGMALATGAGVNLSAYDNINFVINNDLDCCAWGGGFVYNGKFYGATWEPPWGQEAGIYVHELGHSVGLPHSGWSYYSYDSPWDEMSRGSVAQSVQCATYFSVNDNAQAPVFCTEPGGGYIAGHKDALGWIPAANIALIDEVMTTTVRLESNASPLGTGIKMIKVCLAGSSCTGAAARYLTVEARITGRQFENGMPGDGVIIHEFRKNRAPIGGNCFFNNQSGWAVPIDATPGDYNSVNCNSGGRTWPDYALGNAEFVPGQTYKNKALGVTIKVLSKRGSAYMVRVTRSK